MSAYRVEVGELSLYDAKTSLNLHYERDHDLSINLKGARRGGGDSAAFILVELGIDGYATHQARLDFGTILDDPIDNGDCTFRYEQSGDEVRALTDAIHTLTALRDRVAQIVDVPKVNPS